ncbi:MAG: hypothetical protein SGILL_005333 [Bacillariaceae sp.]
MPISKLKFDELPLIGRDNELRELSNSIQRVVSGEFSRGLVLIHGESGTGKTSLITDSEIQKQVRRKGGLFTLGKADLSEQQPLASVQDALHLLSNQILRLPSDKQVDNSVTSSTRSVSSQNTASSELTSAAATSVTLEQVQDKLLHDLDNSEWRLLVEAVPSLAKIMIGQQHRISASFSGTLPNEEHTSSGASFKETSDRLKYVYRHFLRAVSSVCPLVLVMDDCQWADAASLDWIKGLISVTSSTTTSTNETKGRGDSIDGNSQAKANERPSSSRNAEANESNELLTNDNGSIIVIATYRSDEVGEDHALSKMVKNLRTMLASDESDNTQNLFLIQDVAVAPLSLDQVNGMLSNLLRRQADETMELADAVHQKTQGNPFFMVQLLMQMKDDGHLAFNFGLMKWTWDMQTILDTYSATENVAKLMRSKLLHHRAAVRILPVAGTLGAVFSFSLLNRIIDGLKKIDAEEFDLVNGLKECVEAGFLNTGCNTDHFKFVHDKVQEAALELLEEKTKVSIGAIFMELFINDIDLGDTIYSAVRFANIQGMTGDNDRKRLILAEMNTLAGELAMQRAAFAVAAEHLKAAIDLLPRDRWEQDDFALRLFTLAGAAEFCCGNHDRVKTLTDEVLKESSAPLLDKLDIVWTLMEAAEVSVDSSQGFDLGMEVLRDPIFNIKLPKSNLGITASTFSGLAKVKLNKKRLTPQAVQSMPIKTDRESLAIMRTLDKLARHASAGSWLFVAALDDLETAKLCGEAGLAILYRCNYPALYARTLKPLLKGYRVGMRNGSVEGAFWCIYFFLEHSFWSGGLLAPIYTDFQTYIRQGNEYDAQKHVAAMKIAAYMIGRLCGHADELDEAALEELCNVKGGLTLQCHLNRAKMYVACVLGEHKKAADLSLEWHAKCMKLMPGQVNSLEVTFVSAFSSFVMARASKDTKYAKHARACMQKIRSWVSKGCPNCVAHEALLEAEYYSWKKNRGAAIQRYEVAAVLAGRRGLRHIQAMANERHALYISEIGDDPQDANYRLKQAIALYKEWGATHKVLQSSERLARNYNATKRSQIC